MSQRERIYICESEDGKLYMPDSKVFIQEEYRPAINDVVTFFEKLGNKNIHSVYLRGSLVFGLGIEGSVDIDFFVITSNPLNDFDRDVIKKRMDKLNGKYPFLTRFDMGYYTLDQILSRKENVLIKLTSLCVYGTDIKSRVANPRPGKDVAISLSLLEGEMQKTRNEIEIGIYDDTNTKAMCLWIMKRIVRSGLELVSEREGCFTRDLGLCFEKFSEYYPDKKDEMSRALALAIDPLNDTKLIADIFDNLGNWLVVEGKNLRLIPTECNEVNEILTKEITSLFGDRIVCLLRYGPETKSDGTQPSDFDFLLLLDEHKDEDLTLLTHLRRLNLPIDIFVDYKDEIVSKGIQNYQRGRHGSYFFKILASADVLHGNNFYSENQCQLNEEKIYSDLFYRIEEYFYRIQKSVVNEETPNKSQIEKHLGRILTDLLLITGDVQFSDMHKYHYTHIMNKVLVSTEAIDDHTKRLIFEFQSRSDLDVGRLDRLVGVLYKKYLALRGSRKS